MDCHTSALLFFTHFLNETDPFFFCNCYTRSLKCFSIVPKWTLPLFFLLNYRWSVVIFVLCGLLDIFKVLCKIPPFALTGPSVELFRPPHFFLIYLWPMFVLIFSGQVHITFSSFSKWTLHLTAFWVISRTILFLTLFQLIYIFPILNGKTFLLLLGSSHIIFQFLNTLNWLNFAGFCTIV